MKLLFLHQNFPGQFPHLAARFASDPANRVVALGDSERVRQRPRIDGVELLAYPTPKGASSGTHPYLQLHESAVRRGQAVARALVDLRRSGFVPDLVYAHPGWGEALFVKDVMPESRLVAYAEFFYRARGSDVGFDPEYPSGLDDHCRVRVKNSTMLISIDAADAAIAPTRWQHAQYPEALRPRIEVIHDGIDTGAVSPATDATVTLPDGTTLTAADEVLTYAARNLEPYRGFHVFMRGLPEILRRRPQARVLIVGGDEVSYGRRPAAGKTYRELLLDACGDGLDRTRVHFLGRLAYADYLAVLRISSAHVYLTYPFVLSWSMLEAMAAGCLLIASRTAPVEEVIEDGVNGWLTDFFDHAGLADRACEALAHRQSLGALRQAARRTIFDRYDLERICLPAQCALLRSLAG